MAKNSLAEVLSKSQLMVKALQERNENLPVGVTAELREELAQLNTKLFNANAEQEKLKAQLKEKTTEVENFLVEIDKKYALLKKYVKLGVEKQAWREFGIEDKK